MFGVVWGEALTQLTCVWVFSNFITENWCLWLNLLSPKALFGVVAEDLIISLTLRVIAGGCDKPEVSAFAMLFETRIELALPVSIRAPTGKKPL